MKWNDILVIFICTFKTDLGRGQLGLMGLILDKTCKSRSDSSTLGLQSQRAIVAPHLITEKKNTS